MVRRPQLDVPRRERTQDLLQDEAALEGSPVQPPHRICGVPHHLRRTLAERHNFTWIKLKRWNWGFQDELGILSRHYDKWGPRHLF